MALGVADWALVISPFVIGILAWVAHLRDKKVRDGYPTNYWVENTTTGEDK